MVLLIIQISLDATRSVFQIELTVLHFGHKENIAEVQNSEFVFLLQILVQLMHLPENFVLIYGISKFYRYIIKHGSEWDVLSRGPKLHCTRGTGICRESIRRFKRITCTQVCKGVLCVFIALVVAIQIPLSFAPPYLYYVWRSDVVLSYNTSQVLGTNSAIVLFFPHFSNLVDRFAMITVTITVKVLWDKKHERPLDILAVSKEYGKIGGCVASIQCIFEEWFVLKWITYYFSIAGNIILAVRGIFKNNGQFSDHQHTFIYSTTHLIYDLVAFTTIFICGKLMNQYHGKYYKKLEKAHRNDVLEIYEVEKGGNNQLSTKRAIEIMKISTLTPEEPKFKFTPSLCSLSFKLTSAGYLITFALAVIGIVMSILTTFVEV